MAGRERIGEKETYTVRFNYENIFRCFIMIISIRASLSIGYMCAERPIMRSTALASVWSKYAFNLYITYQVRLDTKFCSISWNSTSIFSDSTLEESKET